MTEFTYLSYIPHDIENRKVVIASILEVYFFHAYKLHENRWRAKCACMRKNRLISSTVLLGPLSRQVICYLA